MFKFKLSFVLLLAVIAAASAGAIDKTTVKENYKNAIELIKKNINRYNNNSVAIGVVNILERSIDLECAAEKFQKLKLEKELDEFVKNGSLDYLKGNKNLSMAFIESGMC